MNKKEVIDKITEASKLFREARLIDPKTGEPSNACYGVDFGMCDLQILQDILNNDLPADIDLYAVDGRSAFEVRNKAQGRISSIVYLVESNATRT